MRKSFWFNFFLVLIGIVVGQFTASITSGIKALSWLSYGLKFGTSEPITLDLQVLNLTFGASVNITISTVIFIVLSVIIGRAIARK